MVWLRCASQGSESGKEVGFTPLTLKGVPAGRHALVLAGDAGTLKRTVRVQADERTVARYEITAGFLSVTSRIPVEIFDGTKKLGSSDEGHILLAPGQYKVRLVNTHYGFREDAEFTIKAGEISTHAVTLPQGSLHITTEPGAEIFVEGELMGVAPLAAFRVEPRRTPPAASRPPARSVARSRSVGSTPISSLRGLGSATGKNLY